MDTLTLTFDTEILGEPRKLAVEVPHQGGVVATSKYCPTELLAGAADLLAAVRGAPLDIFVDKCSRQAYAMSKLTVEDADDDIEVHIGALMAVIMRKLGESNKISYGELLTDIDCFALLLKAEGLPDDTILGIYPRVAMTLFDILADNIRR